MGNRKLTIAIPVLIITLGTGSLLTQHKVLPDVNWLWVLGLAMVGILAFVLGGVNKATVVVGPFLFISTFFYLLRRHELITLDSEVPALVIVAGVLMLLARLLPIPPPKWLADEEGKEAGRAKSEVGREEGGE